MKRTTLMSGAGALALALTGCGSPVGRDCGACCKGVGFSGSAVHTWEGSK